MCSSEFRFQNHKVFPLYLLGCSHFLANIIAFDCRTEPSYNFLHVCCQYSKLEKSLWAVTCLLSHVQVFNKKCYLFHLFLNHTVVSSILIHLFIMSSTSKAMASGEALSSRHTAAILHLSLTRFVNLNQMRCHVFYLNMLCSTSWLHAVPSFMAHMATWDSSSLWDTVVDTFIPYMHCFCLMHTKHIPQVGFKCLFSFDCERGTFSYQHELRVEQVKYLYIISS